MSVSVVTAPMTQEVLPATAAAADVLSTALPAAGSVVLLSDETMTGSSIDR